MADTVSIAAAVAIADPLEPASEREYALVPLERIQVHPLNLRRELRGLDELADSIAQNGLLEPVLLVPAAESAEDGGEQFVLIAGHRRHAASVAAKHSPVESIIRRDLDSEGAQVIAMLTENGPRDDLTAIEEAHGYQLALGLNHLTPGKLAKRLGKPRDRVVSRLGLTKLPAHVQDKVHDHQITIHEAEAMVEFASDSEALEVLEGAVGKSSFQFRIEQQRRRRETELRIAAERRQLQQAGVRIIERPQEYSWRSTEKPIAHLIDPSVQLTPDERPVTFTPEAHAAACTFHAAFINPYDGKPEYVCTDPAAAGHESIHRQASPVAAAPAPDGAGAVVDVAAAEADRLRQVEQAQLQAEEEQRQRDAAQQAEVQRQEALAVAARLRTNFLTSLVRRKGRDHLTAVLRLLLGENFQAWQSDAELQDARELAALIDAKVPEQAEGQSDEEHWDDVVANLRAALPTRTTADAIAGALLAIVGHNREWTLAQGHGWSDAACRRYMDFLQAQGYAPTELEQELLSDVEVTD
jgi:ParB/RepB/Spo0J family partition protein